MRGVEYYCQTCMRKCPDDILTIPETKPFAGCFRCKVRDTKYLAKGPREEGDPQKRPAVKCSYCYRLICGRVLQAGAHHFYHLTCGKCNKCGDAFQDGEDMYVQGTAIWHPRCGSRPTTSERRGTWSNGSNQGSTDRGRPSSSIFSTLRSRTSSLSGSWGSPDSTLSKTSGSSHRACSPGIILREYKSVSQRPQEDLSRLYSYSYLTEEPGQGYLRKPIEPYDKPPTSPHFHRPISQRDGRSPTKSEPSSEKKVLGRSLTPSSRSPRRDIDEPIELAHFPAARKPKPGEKAKIERDDFPAPPYVYTDPAKQTKGSLTTKKYVINDGSEDTDNGDSDNSDLCEIAATIGRVFLRNLYTNDKSKPASLKPNFYDRRRRSTIETSL